ncbi:MAG: tRNA 2-thiouridine(34) synthase MnmA [Negativicutes bacterium]|nr:tRNA 2-thiouridine(34) synthase MnmA [Negativicutes bacterium]
MMKKQRVLMAMSGGVDSSLAACLLQEQGYAVIGVTIRNWTPPGWEELTADLGGCCSLSAVEDARRVAFQLQIPFYVLNFAESFENEVVKPFVAAYLAGETPNPCVLCNKTMRFGLLYQKARELQADFVATGHYARVCYAAGRYHLLKGIDVQKDQSYMLYSATQQALAMTLYPLGTYNKQQTRQMARERGLAVAEKPDSQDICFIPDGNIGGFLTAYRPGNYAGEIVYRDGRILGRHTGYQQFTIGQRKGLGLAWPQPLYVLKIDAVSKRVIVAEKEFLYSRSLLADQLNWIAFDALQEPLQASAKIRYAAKPVDVLIKPSPDGGCLVEFREEQQSITPGQAIVFYKGDELLGGGRIRQII